MKQMLKRVCILAGVLALALTLALPALAAEGAAPMEETAVSESQSPDLTPGLKAVAVALAIGIAAGGGGIGMGLATARSAEGISRQPEAEGKIRTMMMLGLVFIETAIIYALLAVILIIFVM